MKRFLRFPFILLSLLTLTLASSCSKDDNSPDNGKSSSLQINGIKIGRVLMATCSQGAMAGEKWVGFETEFYLGSDLIALDFEGTYTSLSQIETGDVIDYDDIWLHSFYVLMGNDDYEIGHKNVSSIGSDYNVEGGNIKVVSVKGSDITLKFNNLELISTKRGGKSFILNGTVTYTIN